MPGTAPAISASDLVKVYPRRGRRPEVRALDGLSFEVPTGRVFGLLGPNGAGKSTTTKILTTLSRPTSGSATVDGHDVRRAPDRVRASIGYVSQGSSTDPVLTAVENLEIAGRLRGLSAADARSRARRLLDEFGLAEASARPVSTFSGGMRRQLDVAAALVHRPAVLFLDEPTTGFDPEVRRQFWDLIRDLQREGTTILLTTHYLDEASELSERAAIIVAGEMASVGRIDELGGPDARVPLVRWREGEVTREQRTPDPGALVAALYARLGEPERLEVVRPSLEDVYLSFLGDEARRATAAGDRA